MNQHVRSVPTTSSTPAHAESVTTVTDDDFADRVLAAPVPVLVDFGADWCAPCRAIEPIIEKIASTFAGRARVVRIDADASPKIAARYRVRALPTVIVFSRGEEHKRHTGATSMDVLVRLLPEAP